MYQVLHKNMIIAQAETKSDCIEALAYVTFPTHITIEKGVVTVCNRIWIQKENKLSVSYSADYSRTEILNDIAEKVLAMNGYKLQKVI